MTPTPVVLEWYEVRLAAQVGVERNVQSIKDGRTPSAAFSTKDGAWEIHVQGACGELAFAKAANRFWAGSVNRFGSSGDVGRIEVRTRSRHDYDLLVRPADADDSVFVLVTGLAPDFLVHGWVRGEEAKRDEWLRDYGGRPPAFFVPKAVLNPLEALLRPVDAELGGAYAKAA